MNPIAILKKRGLVIATGNSGKIREFHRLLAPLEIKLHTFLDFPEFPEADECENTFQGNAKIKAMHAFQYLNLPVIADDSGLIVDALNGEPGVMTARYGGPDLDDSGRRKFLIGNMKDVPDEKRKARFVCVLAFTADGREFSFFRGETEGRILHEDKGKGGFGYDPIFFPEEAKEGYAEMDASLKDAISHRGKAVKKFIAFLKDLNS